MNANFIYKGKKMSGTSFASEVTKFLVEITGVSPNEINDDTDLIESGIIDSLNIVNLLAFIEERNGQRVGVEELDLDQIQSVKKIAENFFVQTAAE